MEISLLAMHSWGVVSANKLIGSDEIKVMLIEHRFATPEGVVHTADVETDTIDTDEGQDVIQTIITNSVTAKWLSFNDNAVLAPDVRRNDDVMVFKMGETDQYYWMDFNSANVKRLETKLWVFSADPNNPVAADFSNAYVLELSSHNKTVTFQTSQANGEFCKYRLQFNMDEGLITLDDDLGNSVTVDSEQTVIKLINANKTMLSLDKKNIFGYAENNIELTAGKTVKVDCNKLIVNAKDSAVLTTPKFTVNGKMDVTEAVTMKATLSVSGALSAASAKIAGLITAVTGKFDSHGPH